MERDVKYLAIDFIQFIIVMSIIVAFATAFKWDPALWVAAAALMLAIKACNRHDR